MTVSNKTPVAEYNGNGIITKFDWDWDMIDDSSINVLVDNEYVTNWSEEDQSVVFDTAPEDGAEIVIYRRTLIRQPEDYQAFGRFHSEKTELSMDRAILIAQERGGDRGNANAPNGIVGGANLFITRGEFDVTVNSERGDDAVVPMFDADDTTPTPGTPDPAIIWAGDPIEAGCYSLPGNDNGIATTIRFRMDLEDGIPTEASAYFPNYNDVAFASWVNHDPSDLEYWMRVTAVGTPEPSNRYQIFDANATRELGDIFQIHAAIPYPADVVVDRDGAIVVDRGDVYIFPRDAEPYEEGVYGPYISVFTFGDTAPSTRTGIFNIEICKDDGTGLPDESWVSRIVTLEAIFNL